MAGFDVPRAASELGMPENYQPEAAIAIGRLGDKSILSEAHLSREQPSGRNPQSDFVFEGAFPGP